MTPSPLFILRSPSLRFTGIELSIPMGEEVEIPRGVTAVIGPNGAGKSSLARIIARGRNFMTNSIWAAIPSPRVNIIEFGDVHSLSGFKAQYYQQRYEATMNDEVPTVAELLAERRGVVPFMERLGIASALGKRVNFLSSGELRRLLIANALADAPHLLILDNPYIGLDPEGRVSVEQALRSLTASGTSLMLLLPDPTDIPTWADKVIAMDCCQILSAGEMPSFDFSIDKSLIPVRPEGPYEGSDEVAAFVDCPVTSAGRLLIPSVNWRICQGEGWALSGPNGSGKSTLLSLIHADNPQAYARPVSIFGHPRGSGESIWDIKRQIGYISPEMHLYFNGFHNRVVDVVAQGLNDTVGMYRRISPAQASKAMEWLRLFGLEEMASRPLGSLSTGEQRMALLARTLIKNPRLLILDEPLHGLDCAHRRAAIEAIDLICRHDRPAVIFVTHNPSELPAAITRRYSLT
ncbi:MAG: ATP-binding cassette domain-containing protein [Pseudoflavonifractor sp.]|nr:ATP-binding cassette domain-containing protein [Alloprevotella sp.]MCM1117109.1 ATP-binding cassette domain-containing protein [Pseudoflavonifractor sp.]